jgi:hypothetical protein
MIGALIFLLLAALTVWYLVSKVYNQPTVDPAALKPVTPPPSKSREPEVPRFQ